MIGRFYSNDPVGYTAKNPVMSFNRYIYVNNNPYKYTDPDGEFLNLGLAAFGAVIGGVTGAITTYAKSGGTASLKDIGGAFVGGAAVGALAGFTGGASLAVTSGVTAIRTVATSSAVSVASGFGGDVMGQVVAKGEVNLGDAALSGALSLGGGLAGGVVKVFVPKSTILQIGVAEASNIYQSTLFGLATSDESKENFYRQVAEDRKREDENRNNEH